MFSKNNKSIIGNISSHSFISLPSFSFRTSLIIHPLQSHLLQNIFWKGFGRCARFIARERIRCHVLIDTMASLWQIFGWVKSLQHLGVLISLIGVKLSTLLLIKSRDQVSWIFIKVFLLLIHGRGFDLRRVGFHCEGRICWNRVGPLMPGMCKIRGQARATIWIVLHHQTLRLALIICRSDAANGCNVGLHLQELCLAVRAQGLLSLLVVDQAAPELEHTRPNLSLQLANRHCWVERVSLVSRIFQLKVAHVCDSISLILISFFPELRRFLLLPLLDMSNASSPSIVSDEFDRTSTSCSMASHAQLICSLWLESFDSNFVFFTDQLPLQFLFNSNLLWIDILAVLGHILL